MLLLRRFTDFILQSRLQAMGTAFVITLVPVIGGGIGILIAALVTLRKGAYEGTFALCAATAPFLLSYAIYPDSDHPQIMIIATGIAITSNVLTWTFALVLRRYNSWSQVLELAALAGVAAVAAIHVFYPDIQQWWKTELTTGFARMGQLAPTGSTVPQEIQTDMIASIKQYATGLVIFSLLFNALLQLLLARWWQAFRFNPGGLRRELYDIRLGYVSAAVYLLSAGLFYTGNAIGIDTVSMMVVTFCFAGLSLAHALLAQNRLVWLWLLLLYAAIAEGLVFRYPIGVVVVSIVALLDTLLDFRTRLRDRLIN